MGTGPGELRPEDLRLVQAIGDIATFGLLQVRYDNRKLVDVALYVLSRPTELPGLTPTPSCPPAQAPKCVAPWRARPTGLTPS
jgi:hypothetical protein